jgi:hypothetical protein
MGPAEANRHIFVNEFDTQNRLSVLTFALVAPEEDRHDSEQASA